MSGAVLRFIKPEHQRALESLPWFLTGALDEGERAAIEQHLRICPACRAELESQRVLREAYIADDASPSHEASLAKLLPRLESARPAVTNWRIRLVLDRVLGARGRMPALTSLALAVQVGIVVALGLMLNRNDPSATSYHTLASAEAPLPTRGDLIVVFDPSVPLRTVQRILIASDARIVDGPLASGGYVLAVPHADLPKTLAWLRAQRDVSLVQPLSAEVAR